MENVRVVKFGLGEVTSNWGTYEGLPAVFIEPVEVPGKVGDVKREGPPKDVLTEGALILQFHNHEDVPNVLAEDIATALSEFGKAKP